MSLKLTTHRSQLPRSGMALGGIGTGGFEIRQDGGFTNCTICNNWPLFPGPRFPFNPKQTLFFLLWLRVDGANQRIVLLQIEDGHGAAAIEGHEFQYMFPWISGVDVIRFEASFPFASLEFETEGVPLRVSMRAWSPFIPGNVKDSALPVAYFDFEVRSESLAPVDVQILATARNIAAHDQPRRIYENTRIRDGAFSAIVLGAGQSDADGITAGSTCLSSFDESSTAYMGWEAHHPYYERLLREYPLPEYDDTSGRNNQDRITRHLRADPRCFVTIGRAARLEHRGAGLTHTFALTWHFPNLYARPTQRLHTQEPCGHDGLEGHFYAKHFDSSQAVARYAFTNRDRLLGESENFHRVFFDSSLPGFVLDQVNSQLNTFRTSSWLTRTGLFGIMEGLNPDRPYAGIATTDVAMYGQIAVSLLFPELDRLTVEMWRKFQNANGSVVHSISCNSREIHPEEANGHRVDLPAQYAFMAIRAGLWSGDRSWLADVWPSAKAALAYVLRERDKDGDSLPDMEGVMCSYDNVPMFGVSPFVATQWLAAVAAGLHTARLLGDNDFIAEYEERFVRGCEALVKSAWNGHYFDIYSGNVEERPLEKQGCMADQMIGVGIAMQLPLRPIVDPAMEESTLRSILHFNYHPDQGLRNCQWPGDDFLHEVAAETWIDQANTSWSGVELNFAAHLYRVGLRSQAEELIRNVDDRHRRWGIYWDHREFGGHYFRPMSALGIPNAFLGLTFDGETLRIDPPAPLPPGRWCVLLPGGAATFRWQKESGSLLWRFGTPPAISRIELPGDCELVGFAGSYQRERATSSTVFTHNSETITP